MSEVRDKRGTVGERRQRRYWQLPQTGETTVFDIAEIARAAASTPRRKVPLLLMVNGVEKGRPIVLSAGEQVLGRGPLADVSIQGRGISRTHMRVTWGPDRSRVVIEDAGSTNGVYVDGTQVTQRALKPGELAFLGPETALRLEWAPEQDALLRVRQYENAIVDDLTGIHNRRYLMSSLEHEMAFARRHAQALCLMLVDIDHFKRVNDDHGHQVGDMVIRQLAGVIADSLRAEDSFARLGGEEFAIVSRDLGPDSAHRMAERLRREVESHVFHHEATTLRCTVSVGAAIVGPPDVYDIATLLKRADANLYAAKNAGRNCSVIG